MAQTTRRYSVSFAGVKTDDHNALKYHDGKMTISYCYVLSKADIDTEFYTNSGYPLLVGEVPYEAFIPSYDSNTYGVLNPMMLNYSTDATLGLNTAQGIYSNTSDAAASYSIYRREYNIYQKPGTRIRGYYRNGGFYYHTSNKSAGDLKITPHEGYIYIDIPTQYTYQYNSHTKQYVLINAYKEYKGEWKPVVINSTSGYLRDYNITNGRSYQYIIYPSTASNRSTSRQVFANAEGLIFVPDTSIIGQGKVTEGSTKTSHLYGSPVKTKWDEWSIVELEPVVDNTQKLPIIKQVYKAKLDQLWLFRFSLETGSQTQNISRADFQTLGQYPKMGFGKSNYASGEVTALLGSEIIPYSHKGRYIERLGEAREQPLSTNEKIEMLQQWRRLVSSRNPKLLKDIKGQSWIVQIVSSNNKPQNYYAGQPDTISFQWKEISNTDNVIIYGDGGYQPFEAQEGTDPWSSVFE